MLKETPNLAPDGLPYRLLTLRNEAGMVVTLMDWGATLLSARVPMPDGSVRETLLGCASPEQYVTQTAYLGASVGRYANRIAQSRFENSTASGMPSCQARVTISCTVGRKASINAAGKSFSRTTGKYCFRWIRPMATRVSRARSLPRHALP